MQTFYDGEAQKGESFLVEEFRCARRKWGQKSERLFQEQLLIGTTGHFYLRLTRDYMGLTRHCFGSILIGNGDLASVFGLTTSRIGLDKMPWPHLIKAPISEAIIDIRATLPAHILAANLEAIGTSIKEGYPTSRVRHRFEGNIKVKLGQAPETSSKLLGPDGYLFSSSDSLQVVQFRLDGFTFSRLKPYVNWNTFRDEAMRLWKIYEEQAGVISISRIGVRYVNMLEIPMPVRALEEYLKYPPSGPLEESAYLSSFFDRVQAFDPTQEVYFVMTHALELPKDPATTLPIFLDIDVFKQTSIQRGDAALWQIIESFREYKNRIFFGSVTDKTVELFK